MKHKFSIIYSWFIKTILFFFPDYPMIMKLRGFLYSLFMKKCGHNFQISSTAILNSLAGLDFGDNVYIAYNTVVIGVDIKIEDNVIIGPNSLISGGNHIFDGVSFRNIKSPQTLVHISSGCWIAGNSTITAGSFLPEKSILAAGGVLTKKYTDKKTIYAGVPAKPIKRI